MDLNNLKKASLERGYTIPELQDLIKEAVVEIEFLKAGLMYYAIPGDGATQWYKAGLWKHARKILQLPDPVICEHKNKINIGESDKCADCGKILTNV